MLATVTLTDVDRHRDRDRHHTGTGTNVRRHLAHGDEHMLKELELVDRTGCILRRVV